MENAFYGESGVKDDTEVQLISEFTTMGVNQKIAHLTRSLDQARLERDKHANQAAAIRQQSSKMASDLMAAESTCGRLRRERDDLRSKVKELTGMSNYKNKSLEEMEQIESYLKSSQSFRCPLVQIGCQFWMSTSKSQPAAAHCERSWSPD